MMNLILLVCAIIILQEATNVHSCLKLFLIPILDMKLMNVFFFLETPFLIKEQKVLRFKVKVDIIVLLQQFFSQRIFS